MNDGVPARVISIARAAKKPPLFFPKMIVSVLSLMLYYSLPEFNLTGNLFIMEMLITRMSELFHPTENNFKVCLDSVSKIQMHKSRLAIKTIMKIQSWQNKAQAGMWVCLLLEELAASACRALL